MAIDLNDTVKSVSNWAFGSPLLNGILGSSVFIAILISIIMILLIMIFYPAKSGTPASVLFKMFVYMFFSTLLVVFLHDAVKKYTYDNEKNEEDQEILTTNVTGNGRNNNPAYVGGNNVVTPFTNRNVYTPYQQAPYQGPVVPTTVTMDTLPASPYEDVAVNLVNGGQVLRAPYPVKNGGNPYM